MNSWGATALFFGVGCGGRVGGSNGLCVSSPTYMLQVPVCQDSQRALPGVSGSEAFEVLIRKRSQLAMIHGVVWLSYDIYVEIQEQHLKVEMYTPTPESYTCTDAWAHFHLKRLNNINVWKAVGTWFPFIFFPSHKICRLFSASARGG